MIIPVFTTKWVVQTGSNLSFSRTFEVAYPIFYPPISIDIKHKGIWWYYGVQCQKWNKPLIEVVSETLGVFERLKKDQVVFAYLLYVRLM